MYFDSEILQRARIQIASQEFVPVSPTAKLGDGRLVYCTAAALARAGLELFSGSDAVAQFDAELAATNEKCTVVEAFRQLGWPVTECISIQARNDKFAPEIRKRRVLGLIDSLA